MSAGTGTVEAAVRAARSAAQARPAPGSYAVVPLSSAMPLLREWGDLATRSAADNVFFHPDFAVPAMRQLGAGVSIATIRGRDRELVALALFSQSRLGRVAPAVRLWAHDYAPLGVPLVDAANLETAAASLLEGLAPADSGFSLVSADMPIEGEVARALVAAALKSERPVDVLDGHVRAALVRGEAGSVDPTEALTPKRRKEFTRQMRRLSDLGAVEFVAVTDAADVRTRFEAFMQLETRGWKGKGGTALISSPHIAEFARDAIANRAEAGGVRVDLIDLEGQPIAMLVTFIEGATAWTWKIAYDEAYAAYSPGAQLMLEVPARLFANPSIKRIDSCASANHPLVDRLWSGRMAIGTLVIGPPGASLLHRAGLAAARAELSARSALRRLRG